MRGVLQQKTEITQKLQGLTQIVLVLNNKINKKAIRIKSVRILGDSFKKKI
jgi:hypothetical protein